MNGFDKLPPEVRRAIDADIEANHRDAPDCACVMCRLLAAVRLEVAAESPWCGTCNPAVTDSPEYRRAFLEYISDPDAEPGQFPVPAAYDPTVRP